MSTKDKIKIQEEINIPDNVNFELIGDIIKISGPLGVNERRFRDPRIKIKKEDNKILLTANKSVRNEKRIVKTLKAHINNLIYGVNKTYTYKLKICSGHFPMSVSISGDKVIIKNFFAEKIPRQAKILLNINVKIDNDIITVTGINKENVSQTAANIEQACRITTRDRRIFMDGIYIISKG